MTASGTRPSDHGKVEGSVRGRSFDWSADEVQLLSEPWMAEAVCAETDPEAFFPEKGGTTQPAKKICGDCAVVEQCLAYALAHDERFGIWGGLSERERHRLRLRAASSQPSGSGPTAAGRATRSGRQRVEWSTEQDTRLGELAGLGWSNVAIGAELGRAHSAVRNRRKSLGMAPSEWRGRRSN